MLSLVAQWKFDESLGATALDSSGNNLNATVHNGAAFSASGRGDGGNVVYFNGSTQYGDVLDSDLLDNAAQMSFSFWVNPSLLDGQPRAVLSKRVDNNNNQAYSIFFHTGNRLYVDIDGSNNRFSSNTVFSTNTWYHVAVVYDGSATSTQRVKLYVNGVLDKTAAETSASIPNYVSNLYLAELHSNYVTKFQGKLDDVRIYNNALTSAEVSRFVTPPTVASAAAVSPSPVTATSASLSVLGSDSQGEAGLTYTWSVVSTPAGATAPTFSANGTNVAKNTTVTFAKAGNYTLRAAIDNGYSVSISDVTFTVSQTVSTILVTPSTSAVVPNGTAQFSASARDQFGDLFASQPTFTWSVQSGGGSITSGGLYTASSSGGNATVAAAASGIRGTAGVNTVLPVMHIKMDELSGNTGFDSSTNHLDVSLVNGPTFVASNRPGGNNALSFNATNQYATHVDSGLLDNTEKLTVALWVKANVLDGNAHGLVAKRVDYLHQNSFSLLFNTDNRFYVDFGDYAYRAASNTIFDPGQWYHIAAVFDGSQPAASRVKIYVNGTLDKTASNGLSTIPDFASDLYIGALQPGYSPLNGLIDDVRIYRDVLDGKQLMDMLAVPAAPTGLSATKVTDYFGHVSLAWTDNADNETGYRVERRAGFTAPWTTLQTLGANATSYLDTTAAPGTLYYYRVVAFNNSGDSAEAKVSVNTAELPIRIGSSKSNPSGVLTLNIDTTNTNYSWVKEYKVDWGDGQVSGVITGTPPSSLSHAYETPGSYTPIIQFVDAALDWPHPYIAHLNYDSTLGSVGKVVTPLPTLSTTYPWTGAKAVTALANGQYLVAGHNLWAGFAVARYNANGTLDNNFGNGGWSIIDFGGSYQHNVSSIAVQGDGKIVVAGDVNISGAFDWAVARFNADGSPDSTFGNTGIAGASLFNSGSASERGNAVAIDSGGKILVSGFADRDMAVVRFTSSGQIDSTFGNGGMTKVDLGGDTQDIGYGISLQENGKIIVSGRSDLQVAVVRFNTNGSRDMTFNGNTGKYVSDLASNGGFEALYHITVDSQTGSILLVGEVDAHIALVRLTSSGTIDTTFGDSSTGHVLTQFERNYLGWTALVDGNDIYVGGMVNRSPASFLVARYSSSGVLDTSFGDNGAIETTITQDAVRSMVLTLTKSAGTTTAVGTVQTDNYDNFALVRMRDTHSVQVAVGTAINTTLTATANELAAKIDLAWSVAGPGAPTITGYRVDRATGAGSFVPIATINNPDETTFPDSTVSRGVTYSYRIIPISNGLDRTASNVASASLDTLVLTATPDDSALVVNLVWNQFVASDHGYRIERSDDGVDFSELIKVPSDQTSYRDFEVQPGHTYYYRIFALGASDDIGPSNTAQAALATPPSVINGSIFHDRNRNQRWDSQLVSGANPYIVYIMDVSDSTYAEFAGSPVGDVDNDGIFNTRRDAEAAAFIALNNELIALGYGDSARVALIPFDDDAYTQSVDPTRVAFVTQPATDHDNDGVPDIEQTLRHFSTGHGGTNFDGALDAAHQRLEDMTPPFGSANVFFLSDGDAIVTKAKADALRTDFGANVRAFGAGTDAGQDSLRQIDPNAVVFTTTDELLGAFRGLLGDDLPEEGLGGWRAFLDTDRDNVLDPGEQSVLTASDGKYEFQNVSPGDYHVVLDQPSGWLTTFPYSIVTAPDGSITTPAKRDYDVTIAAGTVAEDRNFGVVEDGPLPEAQITVEGRGTERSPVIIRVNTPQGFAPFRYSFDVDGDGKFDGPNDVNRSTSGVCSFVPDDNPGSSVLVRIWDSVGQYRDYPMSVTVSNVAPTVSLSANVGGTADLTDLDGPMRFTATGRDVSTADTTAGLTYQWSAWLNNVPVSLGTLPPGQDWIEFASPVAGTYRVEVVVTDKDGGTSNTATQSVTVTDELPHIVSMTPAEPTVVTDTSLALDLTATDNGGESSLIYYWKVRGPADLIGLNDINGTNLAKHLRARFARAGTYEFTVRAVDADGNYDERSVQVVVEQTATTAIVTPGQVAVDLNDTVQFSVDVQDQFGLPFAPVDNPTWEISSSAHGTIDAQTGEYTPSSAGIDQIAVYVASISGTAQILVTDTSLVQMIGAANRYEGPEGLEVPAGEGIAGFVVSPTGSATDYEAYVDWDGSGSGEPEAAGIRAFQLPGDVTAWEVFTNSAHRFTQAGESIFTVRLVHTSTSTELEVTGTVHIDDPVVRLNPRRVTPGVNQLFSGAILGITDSDPTDVFTVSVDWGDGTAIDNTAQVVEVSSGAWEVRGTHTYTSTGNFTATATLTRYQEVGGTGLPTGSVDIPVSVGTGVLGAPTITSHFPVSNSQQGIVWTKMSGALEYLVWAYNTSSGVTRLIHTDGTPTDDDPDNKLYYVDQFLPPGTTFRYTVQAVYTDGTSPESNSEAVQTPTIAGVPQPTGATFTHMIVTAPSGKKSEGVQFSWKALDVGGYRVYRKIQPAGGGAAYWLDLVGPGQKTTPASDPDWTSTFTLETQDGNVIVKNLIDPGSATDGKLAWFDDFSETGGFGQQNSIEYAIIAFNLANDGTLWASDATWLTLNRENGPSQPQGLSAASYPQAIQLTWADRPESDDADFGGWYVERLEGSTWRRLNVAPIQDLGYNDYTAQVGQVSQYRLIAVDQFGNQSTPSETVSYRRSRDAQPPAPAGLVGRPSGVGSITLDWDDVVTVRHLGHVGDDLAHYRIDRRVSGTQDWTTLGTSSTSDYVDTSSLAASTTYEYRVFAVDGDGDDSNPAQTTVRTGNFIPPAQPGTLSGAALSTTSIRLNWSAGTGTGDAVVQYAIFRGKANGSAMQEVTRISASQTSFDDTGLDTNHQYGYRVYAVDNEGELSLASNLISATTFNVDPAPPVVQITYPTASPDTPLKLTADQKVFGIVDDPNNDLQEWKLLVHPLSLSDSDTSKDIIIAHGGAGDEHGSASGTAAYLGTIQSTMLQNGLYELRLVATDDGTTWQVADGPTIEVKTQIKVGSFTLPSVDMQIDVPGGDPIVVKRVYDSSQAQTLGDFGYGWRLELMDTNVRTTAHAGRRGTDTRPALRFGDLVYIDVPGRSEYTFQFLPRPTNYDPQNPGQGLVYDIQSYWAQFVAVDGSLAKLRAEGDIAADEADRTTLTRDGDEFFEGTRGYNPAQFGGVYTLTTEDGMTYLINAVTGKLTSVNDANGRQTSYSADNVSTTGPAQADSLKIERYDDGRIAWIARYRVTNGETVLGPKVVYRYDETTKDLLGVTDETGHEITFEYGSSDHLLTRIKDPNKSDALTVVYDPETGKMVEVIDPSGAQAPVNYGGFDGSTGSTTVTDPAQNSTEVIYDSYGNVIREIKEVRDGTTLKGYLVTVHEFIYVGGSDLFDPLETGITSTNKLAGTAEWQSFFISGDDNEGRRYTASPADMGAIKLSENTFKIDPNASPNDPDLWQLATQMTAGPDGRPRVTTFSKYNLGRPQKTVDSYGRVTWALYDDRGNLRYSIDAMGEGTEYVYDSDGLQTDTYKAKMTGLDADGMPIVERVGAGTLSRNLYDAGRLTTTIDAAGKTLSYSYLPDGRPQATTKVVEVGNGTVDLTIGYNVYDNQGRITHTYDADGKFTQTVYDPSGRVLVTIDRFGGNTISSFDSRGNVVRTLNPDGTETRSVYDEMGRVIWSSDRFHGTTTYTFDRLTGKLTWLTQDNSTTAVLTHTIYDSQGRVIRTERYAGGKINLSDPTTVGTFSTTAPTSLGSPFSVTTTAYDAQSRVIESTDAAGLRTGNIYYPTGELRYVGEVVELPTGQIPVGHRFVPFTPATPVAGKDYFLIDYTTRGADLWHADRVTVSGNIVEGDQFTLTFRGYPGDTSSQSVTSSAAPAASSLPSGTSYAEWVLSDLSNRINALSSGLASHFTASVADGVLVLTPKPGFENLDYLVETAVANSASQPLGRVLLGASSASIRSDWAVDGNGNATINVYDAAGRVVKTIFNDGSFTQTLYGQFNQPVAGVPLPQYAATTPYYLRDNFPATFEGQDVVKIAQRKTGETPLYTHYLYDLAGRLTDVWLPPVQDAETGLNAWPHWRYGYDSDGNETSQTDPKGRVTDFTYDTLGRRITRKLPLGEQEKWTYDDFGRVSTYRDFKGQTTSYVYDRDPSTGGRLTEEHRFLGAASGTPAEITRYVYDELGRQQQVVDSEQGQGARTTDYQYDPITGNITRETSTGPSGVIESIVNHVFDQTTGRLVETWIGSDHPTATTSTLYGYDQRGRLASVSSAKISGNTPATPRAQYQRLDAVGNVVATTVPTTRYAYDAAGNLKTVSLPNGATTTYTFDDLNRLTNETVMNGSSELFEQTYTLLSNGQRDFVIETRPSGAGFSTTKVDWDYDDNGRLIGETRDVGNNGQDGEDYIATYTYDINGNRKQKAFNSANNVKDETVGYTYNANDQLTLENSTIDANDASYTYDFNGSTTQKLTGPAGSQSSQKYLWDLRNRLIAVDGNGDDLTIDGSGNASGTVNDSSDTTYAYDSRGGRTARATPGGKTTIFVNDKANPTGYSQVLEERTSTTAFPSVTYVLGNDVIAQARADATNAPDYFLIDSHGSTRALLDQDSAVVSGTSANDQVFDYDAFGVGASTNPAKTLTALLYAGEQWDEEKSSYYLRGRPSYDPATGRFTSFDFGGSNNADDPVGLHKYVYASSNPVYWVDPSGHSPELLQLLNVTRVYMEEMARRFPAIRVTIRLGKTVFAAATVLGLLSDPQARQEFVMYAIASDQNPGEALAAEFAALKGLVSLPKRVKNIVYLRHLAGDANDFMKKARQLANAAEEGRLVRLSGQAYDNVREAGKDAQNAYRKYVQDRYERFLQHLGLSEARAEAQAAERFATLQADHRIELQLSGALSEPNTRSNLQMLDGSVNGSIGSQLKSEMNRLGLKAGETIDEVIILSREAPPPPQR